jgi:hypothetical protein
MLKAGKISDKFFDHTEELTMHQVNNLVSICRETKQGEYQYNQCLKQFVQFMLTDDCEGYSLEQQYRLIKVINREYLTFDMREVGESLPAVSQASNVDEVAVDEEEKDEFNVDEVAVDEEEKDEEVIVDNLVDDEEDTETEIVRTLRNLKKTKKAIKRRG